MWHSEAARSPYATPSVGVVEDAGAGLFSDKTLRIVSAVFAFCSKSEHVNDTDLSRLCILFLQPICYEMILVSTRFLKGAKNSCSSFFDYCVNQFGLLQYYLLRTSLKIERM